MRSKIQPSESSRTVVLEPVRHELTLLAGGDELGVLQQIEVIRNTGCGHGEGFGDLACGEVALFEHFENATAGGIAKCLKEKVQ